MKYSKLCVVVLGTIMAFAANADWRKNAGTDEQLANLVKLVPGTAHWMFEMGERYKNLYWAAKQHRWDFAQYQVEEIEKLVKVVQLARPARAETAQEFLDTGIPAVNKGVEARTMSAFEPAFESLHKACMECHIKNDHGFVALPLKPTSASSPVLNLPSVKYIDFPVVK